jgi:hypothetical protein
MTARDTVHASATAHLQLCADYDDAAATAHAAADRCTELEAEVDGLARDLAGAHDTVDELAALNATILDQLTQARADLADCRAAQPPPPPPTPPPPPAPISGATITTDTLAGWRETIREDFDIDCAEGGFAGVYPARGIKFYPRPYPDTRRKQLRGGGFYSADYISVKDSICTARMFVDANGATQCNALVPVAVAGNGKWGDAPGMIVEERVRFTYTDGLKSAHLLWPQSDDSTPDGEIDDPEFESSRRVECFVHHQGATVGSDQRQIVPTATVINPREWHTYRLMWVMGKSVTIWCDGQQIAHYTDRIPSTPMHCVLQNESWLASAAVPANAQGTIETDWIRVWVPA